MKLESKAIGQRTSFVAFFITIFLVSGLGSPRAGAYPYTISVSYTASSPIDTASSVQGLTVSISPATSGTVYLQASAVGFTFWTNISLPSGTTTYTVSSVNPLITNGARLSGDTSNGNLLSSTVNATPIPGPSSVGAALDYSTGEIKITWTNPTCPSSSVDYLELQGSTLSNFSAYTVFLLPAARTFFYDGDAGIGNTTYYRVRAFCQGVPTAYSSTVSDAAISPASTLSAAWSTVATSVLAIGYDWTGVGFDPSGNILAENVTYAPTTENLATPANWSSSGTSTWTSKPLMPAPSNSNGVLQQVVTTANETNGSAVLTSVASTSLIQPGWVITGTGIPFSTLVSSVSGTSVTMIQPYSGTNATGVSVTFTPPLSTAAQFFTPKGVIIRAVGSYIYYSTDGSSWTQAQENVNGTLRPFDLGYSDPVATQTIGLNNNSLAVASNGTMYL